MSLSAWRLLNPPPAGKVLRTAFLLLIGFGYLTALLNVFEQHQEADLGPGLTLDDLRRTYHGLETTVRADAAAAEPSKMLQMVRPGGEMRKHLEKGSEAEVTTLMAWLEKGAPETDFATPAAYVPEGPSPQAVIAKRCVMCHNRQDGEKPDVPYAEAFGAEVQYALVAKEALSPLPSPPVSGPRTVRLAPTGRIELVLITHGHMLSMPVFVLSVGGLFLMTGLPERWKLLLGPAPMIVMCADFASWWLARAAEPFVYVIAGAGAVFGAVLGLQILCVVGSMWLGRRPGAEA